MTDDDYYGEENPLEAARRYYTRTEIESDNWWEA